MRARTGDRCFSCSAGIVTEVTVHVCNPPACFDAKTTVTRLTHIQSFGAVPQGTVTVDCYFSCCAGIVAQVTTPPALTVNVPGSDRPTYS